MDIQTEPVRGEEREGYYVQPMMKRIWAIQLDMLKTIDHICQQHDIHYLGWFGTLLGAVRHHGFIPWDDDMDLAMLRNDHERFRHHAKTELPEDWVVFEREPGLISVFNTKAVRLDQGFLDRNHGCPYQTGIDIFCMDGIPADKAQARLQLNLFWSAHSLCLDWDLPENDTRWEGADKWAFLKELEGFSGFHFDRQRPIKEQLYFLGDRIAAMYWDTGYDDVTNLIWLYDHPHYQIPRACFDRIIQVPFEDTTIPIPEDHDFICRYTYGDDYMTPIKGCKHAYLKIQVEKLRKYFKDKGKVMPTGFDMTFEDAVDGAGLCPR